MFRQQSDQQMNKSEHIMTSLQENSSSIPLPINIFSMSIF